MSTDRLVDEVWGAQPPPTAVKTVQVYVSQLRKVLGEGVLETRGRGYALQLAADQLDAEHFEHLLVTGRELLAADDAQGRPTRSGRGLGSGGDSHCPTSRTSRLRRRRSLAWTSCACPRSRPRIEADLALGRHAALVPELEALVLQQPLRERLRAQLMLALYRSGRQADALEGYQQARTDLDSELGLEPGRELQELEQAILAPRAGARRLRGGAHARVVGAVRRKRRGA